MARTKLSKVIELLWTVSPLCARDRDWWAVGYDQDAWLAWAILRPGYEMLVFHTAFEPATKDPNDCTHKELDLLLKLAWRPPNPLGTLDLMAREADNGC